MSQQHRTSDDEWDTRFFRLAKEVATWSKDPDKKVGAIIVSPDRRKISIGYNGFVRGADDDEVLTVEQKLERTVHAELNAILNSGFAVRGSTLYCTKFLCVPCANAVIQSGIVRVVAGDWRRESKWAEQHAAALKALTVNGVAGTFVTEVTEATAGDDAASKMEALATWLDVKFDYDEGDVQRSLRSWARDVRAGRVPR